jgi:hypothetical protein
MASHPSPVVPTRSRFASQGLAWFGAQPPLAQGRGPNPSVAAVHGNSAHDSTPKGPSLTVSQRIERNPQLAARLQSLLPAGMTLDQAAAGFGNQGHFIAALHVSHNLNIPFADLKADMTGANHDSLGHAIHALKPAADATAEVKKADREADRDIKDSKTDTNKSQEHRVFAGRRPFRFVEMVCQTSPVCCDTCVTFPHAAGRC